MEGCSINLDGSVCIAEWHKSNEDVLPFSLLMVTQLPYAELFCFLNECCVRQAVADSITSRGRDSLYLLVVVSMLPI